MDKKIEDYLHLYYHSKGELTTQDDVVCEGRVGTLMSQFLPSHIKTIKPLLRPLSDMTDEEAFTLAEMNLIQRSEIDKEKPITRNEFGIHVHYWVKTSYEYDEWDVYAFTIHEDLTMSDHMGCCHDQHRTTLYLLKQGFDLFGLIDAGLAIPLTNPTNR